ncbi:MULTISPECIES: hypothetical protein [Bacillaceae]|uniref:Transposase n=1 Tax=Evansella alkalicola TaxID=745819 RepID=A0ABS6JP47_9BACI|nr:MULTISPECIES: hypothetical protein [Bacillaceae]MBU9720037.1 hypothetical protein [Bacillus alkalicola]
MIKKAEILERLNTLVGEELTDNSLHEALFCEDKDHKKLRRFYKGKHQYVKYKLRKGKADNSPLSSPTPTVDITVLGNPNIFTAEVVEYDGRIIIQSKPKIKYSYI